MQHQRRSVHYRAFTCSALFFFGAALPAYAGPPFATDDPEPTPYRSYELYIASDYARSPDGVDVTVPHFEFNYGLLPNIQVSMTLPLSGSRLPLMPMHMGYGDTEFEIKARIIQESDTSAQISVAPTIVVPTGNANLNLGGGSTKTFFPVWLEKGLGKYTVYGGAGLWHNPGEGNRDYTFGGVAVIRDMGHGWTIGSEAFGQTADTTTNTGSVGFNVGAIRQYDEHHEYLFSAGRSIHGSNTFSAYAALGFLLGPRDKAAPDAADAKPDSTDRPATGAASPPPAGAASPPPAAVAHPAQP